MCPWAFCYHDVSLLRDEKRVDAAETSLTYHFPCLVGKEDILKGNSRTGTEGGTDLLTFMRILLGITFMSKMRKQALDKATPSVRSRAGIRM